MLSNKHTVAGGVDSYIFVLKKNYRKRVLTDLPGLVFFCIFIHSKMLLSVTCFGLVFLLQF